MSNSKTALRIFLFTIASLFLFATLGIAQTTQVTGVVKDLNGIPYAGAQMKAQLVFAGTPVSNPTVTISVLAQCKANGFGSAPCQVPFTPSNGPFNLDAGGNIPGGGITLQDNTQVTPSGTQWTFSVNSAGNPPPLGTGPQTCSLTVTISGSSQSLTSSFGACPSLSNTGGAGGATSLVPVSIVSPGLIAYYQAQPTDIAASLKDYSGNGNNATGTTGTAPTLIANTGGILCPAAGGIVLPPNLNAAQTIQIEVGYQPSTTSASNFYFPVIGNGTPASSGVGLGVRGAISTTNTNQRTQFGSFANNFSGGGVFYNATISYVAGVEDWALVMSGSDQLYNNGLPAVMSQIGTSIGKMSTGTYQLCGAGAGAGNASQTWFNGQIIYSALFYSTSLTAAQIAQNHVALQLLMQSRGITPFPFRNDTTDVLWAYGDSITAGAAFTSWPYRFTSAALAAFGVQDQGVAGITSTNLNLDAPQVGYSLCSTSGGRTAIVLLTGANDGVAQTIFGNAQGILQSLHSLQCSTIDSIILTMLDKDGAGGDAIKNAYNLLVRTNCPSMANYCIDTGGTVALGANGAATNTTYYQGDQLHPTQAGGDVLTWVTQRGILRYYGNHDWSTANVYTSPAAAAVAVTAATETANTMTFTTAANTFKPGDCIIVAGVTPAGYNSTFANSAGLNCWYALTTSATSFTAFNQNTGLGSLTVAGTASDPEQQDQDQTVILNFGAGNFTLESCEGISINDTTRIKNINAVSSTIVPFGTQTIDGAATLTIAQNQTVILQAQLISPSAGGCNWLRVQ